MDICPCCKLRELPTYEPVPRCFQCQINCIGTFCILVDSFDGAGFGKRVHEVRTKREMSLRDAAEEMGISFNTLWRVEKFQNSLAVESIARVARWAGLSIDEWVG